VIGINSQIVTAPNGGNGNVGIAFAVPINTAKELLPRLERGRPIAVAWLGASGAAAGPGRGVIVQQLVAGGPAQNAGVRSGDEIEAISGRRVSSMEGLQQIVESERPGQAVVVLLRRRGRARTIRVVLGSRPA
jgi:putative serine protease PepD